MNNDHLVLQVFPHHELQVSTPIGLILRVCIVLKHFEMYIMITDIMGEKRTDLIYSIRGKEVTVISMISDSIQYQIKEPLKVMLMNKERWLLEGIFMDRELNMSIGRKVIMLLDVHDHTVKMDNLAGVTEMVLSLDELNNTDNLEDRSLSNILLRHHVTGSGEITCLKPVTPQYNQLRTESLLP